MKYIVIQVEAAEGDAVYEFPFIFPNDFVHKQVFDHMSNILFRTMPIKNLKPISAGEISSLHVGGSSRCHGKSESLGVESRGSVDNALISLLDYTHGIQ